MKIIKTLFLAIILCVMVGCAKDSLSSQDGSQQTLLLKVETPSAAASDEDLISDARIIAFRDANTLDANSGMIPITSGETITQGVTTATRDIYVFANESRVSGMTAQLDRVRTLSSLQAIQVPYSATIAPPFLSSVMETKILTDNTSMTANVERTVSKVVLTIGYEWSVDKPHLKELVIDRVQVKNLPQFSYLIAQPYTQAADASSKVIEGDDLADITPDGFTYESKPLTIYIPEFIGATSAAGRHAYLEIVGHYMNFDDGIITSTYRLPLSSNMATNGTIADTNYDIARNTAFIIDATIKDFGELNNVVIGVNVQGWQRVDSTPEDVGHYVFLESVTADGVTIADGSNLNDMGTKLKVTCKTNIGGWYTVTRDMDNNIIDKSSPTESVTSGATSQSVEIDIPKLAELTYGQNYTVSIYQSNIAPEESVGHPVKVLKFTQYGGFIPNSLLSAAGWPADPERKKGLQLAKIGNFSPTAVTHGIDPLLKWSLRPTRVGTEEGLGFGKGNYAKLKVLEVLYFPIGQACKDLGPEWYVPSIEELALIYENHGTMGTSYRLDNWVEAFSYWSSSEDDDSYGASWAVHFSDGSTTTGPNMNLYYRVRCVREI